MKHLIGIIVVCLIFSSVPGFAASTEAASIEGSWKVTGTATVTGAIPSLLSLKVTFIKNQAISDTFVFNSGTLSTQKLGSVGTYTVGNKGNVVVDISNIMTLLQDELNSKLPSGSTVSVTKHTFNIKQNGATNFTGTLIVNINVDSILDNQPVTAVIQMVCTLSGVKISTSTASVYEDTDTIGVISNFIVKKAIKPILSRINTK